MEDPILLVILLFGFLVTSAICHNLVGLLQDLNRGGESNKVSKKKTHMAIKNKILTDLECARQNTSTKLT